MDIKITQNIIDYIINNRSRFEMDVPKLGEKWNVESITTYSGVNCGNPVIELSNDNKDWMRLPKELLYQQLEGMLDEALSNETSESWNKRLQEKPVNDGLEEAAKKAATQIVGGKEKFFLNDYHKFKAGAKWQKEQILDSNALLYNARIEGIEIGKAEMKQKMMKDAIDAQVLENYDGKVIKYDETIFDEKLSGCKVFDKVKVIIIKEDLSIDH